ncbi:hypothetical protein J2Z32_001949 [Paenibacillus turicensis]|uniref:DUF4179 domain-containing protein n=1 Tax=Paenibacillus turicensis TaxID=160487 RepID=A0ABS4FRW1_9BACL|nr:DUF4179 domain-containing protein [Paenibacillus turicensis]MBP1905319.1 hypothetical protein [Paenibacillus turicensis]
MTDKVQRILNQDVNDIQDKDQISDMILSNTIRNGIREGKRREMKKRWMTYSIGAVATAMVAVILFIVITPTQVPKPKINYEVVHTTPSDKEVDLERFQTDVETEFGLNTAIYKKLITPIQRTVEYKGLKVDVIGSASDGRRLYFLFTAQNNLDYAISPYVESITFSDIKKTTNGVIHLSTTNAEGNQIMPGDTQNFVYVADIIADTSNTDVATVRFSQYDSKDGYKNHFMFTVPIKPNQLEDQKRIYYPKDSLIVDGQKINIKKMQFTPLNTYLDLEYDSSNTKQIFKLLEPTLIGQKGTQKKELNFLDAFHTTNRIIEETNKVTLIFNDNNLDKLNSTYVSLKVSGISAIPKDKMKVSIDLKEKKIVEAPDEHLKIVEPDTPAAEGEILLLHKLEDVYAIEPTSISHAFSFTDAEGKKHKLLTNTIEKGSGLSISNSEKSKNGNIEEYRAFNFGKEALDYPQPLTVNIERYYHPIMESQAVQLLLTNKNE